MKINKIALSLFFFLLITPVFSIYAQQVNDSNDFVSRMALIAMQLSAILFAAWSGGALFRRLRMPGVLGEIIIGAFIGPYVLGSIPFFGFPGGLFPLNGTFPISPELYSFTSVASIILLFLVGLETDVELFSRFSIAGTGVGIGGVVFSFLLGDIIGVIFSPYLFGVSYGFTHPVNLFLGVISTATSVGISARILSEKRKIDSPEGMTILSGAVIDDVLGIIVLAVVIGISRSGVLDWKEIVVIAGKAFAIWGGFTVLGLSFSRYLSVFLKKFGDKSTISVMSLALALLLAGIFEKSGLAMIVGAYIAGVSLSNTDISYLIKGNLAILEKFFVPIFFCVMGMLINLPAMFSWKVILVGGVYTVFAVLGKILGCGIPAMFLNFTPRGALRIGVGMVPRGEIALIIAGIGLSSGILEHEAFNIVIIMTFVTTIVTSPILAKLLDSEKPVLKKEHPVKRKRRQIEYKMPNQETAEFVLNKVIEAFDSEGFFVHQVEMPEKLYQIRKEESFITLSYINEKIIIDCFEQDMSFVYTLFYEVLADLEYIVKHLQMFTTKEEIGKKIFDEKKIMAREKPKPYYNFIPSGFEVNLKGQTKAEIIRELIDLCVSSGQLSLSRREEALRDVFERESNMSTGMQDGIALPHAKTAAVKHIVCAVGLKKQGLNFDSLDGKPSGIFIITLTPKQYPEPYLQFMAKITKSLMNAEHRERILSCEDNVQLYRVFTES